MRTIHRGYQMLLLATFLPWCWLGMMAIHEAGHVAGALATGGRVARVVLDPLTISRTDLSHNPHPAIVAWSGPLAGVLLPLAAYGLWWYRRLPFRYLIRVFAGCCLIANGVYLGLGSFWEIGDAGDLLRHGVAPWQLQLFGLLTLPLGLMLWHNQGEFFGIGRNARTVDRRAAWLSLGLLLATLVVGLWVTRAVP